MFIPIIIKNKRKYQSEVCIKYFLIQAFASIILLRTIFTIINSNLLKIAIIIGAIIVKIGAAPTHQWAVAIIPGIRWQIILTFIIPQKIGPLLFIEIIYNKNLYNFIVFFVIITAIVGSIGGLIFHNIKKIIAYSSISHIRWIITAIMVDRQTWKNYMLIYALISVAVIYNLKKIEYKTIRDIFFSKKRNQKTITAIRMLNLAGLPPFSGFIIKIFVIQEALNSNIVIIVLILLRRAILSLFFYSRIIITNIFWASNKKNIIYNKKRNNWMFILVNFISILSRTMLVMVI